MTGVLAGIAAGEEAEAEDEAAAEQHVPAAPVHVPPPGSQLVDEDISPWDAIGEMREMPEGPGSFNEEEFDDDMMSDGEEDGDEDDDTTTTTEDEIEEPSDSDGGTGADDDGDAPAVVELD